MNSRLGTNWIAAIASASTQAPPRPSRRASAPPGPVPSHPADQESQGSHDPPRQGQPLGGRPPANLHPPPEFLAPELPGEKAQIDDQHRQASQSQPAAPMVTLGGQRKPQSVGRGGAGRQVGGFRVSAERLHAQDERQPGERSAITELNQRWAW